MGGRGGSSRCQRAETQNHLPTVSSSAALFFFQELDSLLRGSDSALLFVSPWLYGQVQTLSCQC